MPTTSARSLFPFSVAFAVFGLGLAAAVVVSLTTQNLNLYRAQFTAWLSMALATPAFALYALGLGDAGRWRAWRWFWTFAALAYAVHFFYAMRAFHFSVADVYEKQGTLVATSNYVVTVLWAVDVVLAWAVEPATTVAGRALRFVTSFLVFTSFFVASVAFRSGLVTYLGIGMSLVVAGCIAVRLLDAVTAHQTPAKANTTAAGVGS